MARRKVMINADSDIFTRRLSEDAYAAVCDTIVDNLTRHGKKASEYVVKMAGKISEETGDTPAVSYITAYTAACTEGNA